MMRQSKIQVIGRLVVDGGSVAVNVAEVGPGPVVLLAASCQGNGSGCCRVATTVVADDDAAIFEIGSMVTAYIKKENLNN